MESRFGGSGEIRALTGRVLNPLSLPLDDRADNWHRDKESNPAARALETLLSQSSRREIGQNWSERLDSNQRHLASKASTLPRLSYSLTIWLTSLLFSSNW